MAQPLERRRTRATRGTMEVMVDSDRPGRPGKATLSLQPTSSVPVALGQVLADRYRIERVLGSGGMGVVVAATHLGLQTRVAIKFLKPDSLKDEEARARLFREARAAARTKGDHVVQIIDVGMLESGAPYVVMEYLQGADLATVLRANGPLPVADAVAYVLQVCEAVHHAHALGIVHRDLKPSNVFLTRDAAGHQRIKVLDFGLSKLVDVPGGPTLDTRLTATHSMLGTPLYMSPEQLTNASGVDHRTDIWSIGAILFQLIAGRPPFEARSLPQLCTLIMYGSPRSLSNLRAGVPDGLEAVINRCLAKLPDRYANVEELARALARFTAPPKVTWLDEVRRAHAVSEQWQVAAACGVVMLTVAGAAAWVAFARSAPQHTAALRSSPPVPVVEPRLDGKTVPGPSNAGGAAPDRPVNGSGSRAGLAATRCSVCIASNCDPEYQACRASPACERALQNYNKCVSKLDGSLDATCSEKFGTDPDRSAQRLASCAFVAMGGPIVEPGRCTQECIDQPISVNACAGYCNCMGQTCESTMAPADCPSICAKLSPEQVRCRTYHCFLGSQTQPELDCQHAIGRLDMCP